jgi:hypothetical protein
MYVIRCRDRVIHDPDLRSVIHSCQSFLDLEYGHGGERYGWPKVDWIDGNGTIIETAAYVPLEGSDA